MATKIINNPSVSIDSEVLIELLHEVDTEGQIIVHCIPNDMDMLFRIWPTTFLEDRYSDIKSQLVHVEGLSKFPNWSSLSGSRSAFTLIFGKLPSEVKIFNLKEYCAHQGGEFQVESIIRNKQDVYYVAVN